MSVRHLTTTSNTEVLWSAGARSIADIGRNGGALGGGTPCPDKSAPKTTEIHSPTTVEKNPYSVVEGRGTPSPSEGRTEREAWCMGIRASDIGLFTIRCERHTRRNEVGSSLHTK